MSDELSRRARPSGPRRFHCLNSARVHLGVEPVLHDGAADPNIIYIYFDSLRTSTFTFAADIYYLTTSIYFYLLLDYQNFLREE